MALYIVHTQLLIVYVFRSATNYSIKVRNYQFNANTELLSEFDPTFRQNPSMLVLMILV